VTLIPKVFSKILGVRWNATSDEFYSELEQIRIPRWVGFQPEVKVEHHGFCEASQKEYGAAIYLRVEEGHNIMTRLLTAKTRVATVKTESLPRLELCGALLLSEIIVANMPISNPTFSAELIPPSSSHG